MKQVALLTLCALYVVGLCAQPVKVPKKSKRDYCFVENKGQIKDQYGAVRNDVQYALLADGLSIFIGNGQIHYQFIERAHTHLPRLTRQQEQFHRQLKDSVVCSAYRVDVALAGANKQAAAIAEEQQPYYENYCYPKSRKENVIAHTYRKITYKNIYDGIDWVLSVNNGTVEQTFLVHPGGDPSLIRSQYSGQSGLVREPDGSLTIRTPMGYVRERPPICVEEAGDTVAASFVVRRGKLSYQIAPFTGRLAIDPILEWGTYFGPDSSFSPFYAVAVDDSANIYACGLTFDATGTVATSGAYQAVYGGAGDAYLVKFDSACNFLWGTYYGGSQYDAAASVTVDKNRCIYIAGTTESSDSVATPGAFQTAYAGNFDGFLAKFNSLGQIRWSTYYGGDQQENAYSVCTDSFGHVYVAGVTSTDDSGIATPGSFQPTWSNPGLQYNTGFLVQFDTNGVRKWGTYHFGYYFSSTNDEFQAMCTTDGLHLYYVCNTNDIDSMTTPGCYQPDFGSGVLHAFVAKFDSGCHRIWATFLGGNHNEINGPVVCDHAGNVIVVGTTDSDSGLVSAGCFQPTLAGDYDNFIAKFDSGGHRLWTTYMGGTGTENIASGNICVDYQDNIYVCGQTSSDSGIASPGAWQPVFGGGDNDAFLASFDSAGNRNWSTYYGGTGDEYAFGCSFDGKGVIMAGQTTSPNGIANPRGWQPMGGGLEDYANGFIAKFADTTHTAGVPLVSAADVEIFPSPNRGTFTVSGLLRSSVAPVAFLTVLDASGHIVGIYQATVEYGMLSGAFYQQISLGDQTPAGVYYLRIDYNGRREMLKFIKE
jgi:hypothetical protein